MCISNYRIFGFGVSGAQGTQVRFGCMMYEQCCLDFYTLIFKVTYFFFIGKVYNKICLLNCMYIRTFNRQTHRLLISKLIKYIHKMLNNPLLCLFISFIQCPFHAFDDYNIKFFYTMDLIYGFSVYSVCKSMNKCMLYH